MITFEYINIITIYHKNNITIQYYYNNIYNTMHTVLAETRLLEKVHFANSYKLRRQSSYFIAVYLVLNLRTFLLSFDYSFVLLHAMCTYRRRVS